MLAGGGLSKVGVGVRLREQEEDPDQRRALDEVAREKLIDLRATYRSRERCGPGLVARRGRAAGSATDG
ncbi:hypothetical protein [Nonomuraea sp. NPDC049695]|uniref:hypothetical protein n=1 Tax=Nonomuraea sp. NPDC049695 TaxID=3154734 RepID=UPI00342A475C